MDPAVTHHRILPMLWALKHRPLALMRTLYSQPPGVHCATLLGRRYLIVTDPQLVRHVLADNVENYRKNYGAFLGAVGRSSLVTHAAEWQRVRSVNQRAFRAEQIAAIVDANCAVIDTYVDRLQADAARSSSGLDIARSLGGLMIAMTANGMFARATRRHSTDIYNDVDSFLPVMDRSALCVTALGRFLTQRRARGFAAALDRWQRIPREIRTDRPLRDPTGTLLWHLEDAFGVPGEAAKDCPVVSDEVRLFLAAGSQTSAASLAFALHLLWRNPEIMQSVRQQLREHGISRAPSSQTITQLSRLSAVMAETLRLYPPVWAISRVALGHDELGGCRVQPNDVVIISYFGLHRSALHWDQPDSFDPSRFQEETAGRRSYTYLPFGAGPRACIGAQLAGLQTVGILAALLSRFDVEFLHRRYDLTDREVRPGISLWPRRPLRVRLACVQ